MQGRLVLGRTAGLRFGSERSAAFRLRVYSGRGRVLVCWTPYWNEHVYRLMTGHGIEGSPLE